MKRLAHLLSFTAWRVMGIVCLFGALLAPQAYSRATYPNPSPASRPASSTRQPADDAIRRVNIPFTPTEDISWIDSSIFWFGVNEQGYPSRNYVDVRVTYSPESLWVRFVVIDYFLWYQKDVRPSDDLTQYDAVALYLDTGHDRAALPQPDDYYLLAGSHHYPSGNAPEYHRQGRGDGSGWDTTWDGVWNDGPVLQWWCNPGPNGNNCDDDPELEIDYGWTTFISVTWQTLGLSGPPSEGTVWGLGTLLYDRDDQPPAGGLPIETWPETFDANSPASWGELHFGLADYQPPQGVPAGSVVIQSIDIYDNTVEDSWMGGGGWCQGGHMGHGEENHGAKTELFVGAEMAPTHFPCYSKSFLRFSLDAVPPGKVILSATLTLHHWGDAGAEGEAQPSWVHLFTITDPWEEMVIHWNNAPLAQENVAETWITPNPVGGVWGDPYDWDATQAVAEAYALGQPASMAIYSSDTAQHSTKYLKSSESGETYATSRPKLTVVWGDPLATLSKQAAPWRVSLDSAVTYTLIWAGVGSSLSLIDALPAGVSAPTSLQASSGQAVYNPVSHQVEWQGAPAFGEAVSLVYVVTVEVSGPAVLNNTATLTIDGGASSRASASIVVDGYASFLPLVLR